MRIKDLDIYISDGNYSSKYPRSDEFVENGIPFIRANNLINGDISDDDMYFITEEKHSILLKGHVKSGDVLITTRGNIGQVAIVPERHNDSNINAQLVLLRTNPDRIYNRYLLWALQSYHAQKQILELQTGSTLKQLPVGRLEQIKIKLFELSVQRKIASNLDKVTHTIDLCNAILEKLDLLVKSRFVEMFGDVLKNDKKWIERPLGEICEKIVRYPTFYGMDYIESGTRVIRIGNILNDGHMETDDENYVFVYEGVNDDFPETVVEENDIIMAVRGDGSAAKRIGFITENCLVGANISPNLIRIKANSSYVIPIFLFYYLTGEIGQKRLDAYVNKTAKKNIAAKDIVKVISPVPPLALQEHFAAFVEQTDKSKSAVKQVLEKAETLKKALMQEYFG